MSQARQRLKVNELTVGMKLTVGHVHVLHFEVDVPIVEDLHDDPHAVGLRGFDSVVRHSGRGRVRVQCKVCTDRRKMRTYCDSPTTHLFIPIQYSAAF